MFSSKTLISLDILDDMGVSKLSAKVFFFFFKVNYSFKLYYNADSFRNYSYSLTIVVESIA